MKFRQALVNFTSTQRLNDWNQVKLKLPNGTNLNLTASKPILERLF
jgi:hypothetical protein